jgi:two-component system sensor histidine kinase GlrK
MRISSKIIYGYGFIIILMSALALFLFLLISQMRSFNESLTEVNFEAARTSLRLIGALENIDEFTRKFFALRSDAEYAQRLEEYQEGVVADLDLLGEKDLSEAETAELKRMRSFWSNYMQALESERQEVPPGESVDPSVELADSIAQLKFQAQNLYKASTEEFTAVVERSSDAGSRAITVSWVAAVIALVLGCFVAFFIVQSISSPLRHLTQGTRAISEGKFYYRLDTSQGDEFAQLAKDFNTMTARLKELDQMKKDFVSHVSHEMKAPLASMQETNRLLLDQIPGDLTPKQKRLLELNLQSGQRLSTMIANLLDLSRMEAGVMEYELKSNNLVDLAGSAITEYEARAAERNLSIDQEVPVEPLMVHCDGDRIIQVIGNLIGNAIKFSPKEGTIRCRILATPEAPTQMPKSCYDRLAAPKQNGGYGLVTVWDKGPGIPDPHKEEIFEKFHQVKKGKKLPGQGPGLGLAISKTIVEAHRGAIWVEDNPGGGSVFYLLLPCGVGGEVSYRESSPI